jgi:hypothetical protein
MIVLRKSFPLLSLLALTLLVSACSAGAIQKDALCQRSSRLDIANSNVGNMPQAFGSYTGLSLKSQLLDDLEALTVAQEVGPTSLDKDFAYLIRVNQSLFEVMTDLSWDTSVAATNQSIDESLIEFTSITTTRHIARISEYLLKNCAEEAKDNVAPPDSVVEVIPTSTSLLAPTNDRTNLDPPVISENISLGLTIAESLGIEVSNDVARCLGEKAQAVSQTQTNVDDMQEAFNPIFAACGVDASSTTIGG